MSISCTPVLGTPMFANRVRVPQRRVKRDLGLECVGGTPNVGFLYTGVHQRYGLGSTPARPYRVHIVAFVSRFSCRVDGGQGETC